MKKKPGSARYLTRYAMLAVRCVCASVCVMDSGRRQRGQVVEV